MAQTQAKIYRFHECTLETQEHRLQRGDDEISLQPQTFELLLYLVSHPGRLIKKQELLDAVWPDSIVTEGALTRCIWNIRTALGDDASLPSYVQTVPRLGYKFIAPVENITAVSEEVEEEEVTTVRVKVTEEPEESSDLAAGLASPPPERRQLSVLCCTVEIQFPDPSFPDPEQWQQVLQAYHGICRKVASRSQGQIAKSFGGELVIGFGYPRAHEHDAQRAVRAGLGILQGAQRLRARLEQDQGITITARGGIDTGLVVTKGGGDQVRSEALALAGEPLTIAARLQELAEPDRLLIGAATERLVEGFFDCQELGASSLKGVARPIEVYQVRQESEARNRLERSVTTAGLTPLVGREWELAKLPAAWEKAQQGQGQIVSVVGEAGIGKSRLTYEFKRWLEQEEVHYLEGSCFAYGDRISYLPFLRLCGACSGWRPMSRKPTPSDRSSSGWGS